MERNIVEKAVQTQIDNKKKINVVGQLGWFTSENIILTSPSHDGEPVGTAKKVGVPYATLCRSTPGHGIQ